MAEIEYNINEEIHAKAIMVDIDDIPKFPESMLLDVLMVDTLLKLTARE